MPQKGLGGAVHMFRRQGRKGSVEADVPSSHTGTAPDTHIHALGMISAGTASSLANLDTKMPAVMAA